MKKETCYEYFACKKRDCVMFDCGDKNCWEVEGTKCNNHTAKYLMEKKDLSETKEDICKKSCFYYKDFHNNNTSIKI